MNAFNLNAALNLRGNDQRTYQVVPETEKQHTRSLTLIGKTLKVEGKSGTLALADLHNRRKIPHEAKC